MSKTKTLSLGLGAIVAVGAAILPMTAYADNEPTSEAYVDINVNVSTVLSMTLNTHSVAAAGGSTGAYVCDTTATPNCSGVSQVAAIEMLPNSVDLTTMYTDVSVSTNSAAGFTLTLIDSDDNNNLVNANSDTINAISSKPAAGSNAGWAVSVNATDVWNKVPKNAGAVDPAEQPLVIENYTPATPSTTVGRVNTVHYGVATSDTQPTGTYTDTVVYTATVNGSGSSSSSSQQSQ